MAASSATTMISPPKRSLVHPFHEHALIMRELSERCKVSCVLCKQNFHGPAYCCEECNFILHEACAEVELPHQIQGHPSHCPDPDHLLNLDCDDGVRGYRCSDCGFGLDALTAIATRLPLQDVEEETIRYFGHEEHPLSSFQVETMLEAQCRCCGLHICAGQVYGCRSCLFFLHGACSREHSLEIQHPLHRQHPLTLLAPPEEDTHECFACSNSMESGPAYCCQECGFSFHVGCANLTMDGQTDNRMKELEKSSLGIKHFSHKHRLTPFRVRELVQSRMECKICRVNISEAEAFACSVCRFFLHKSCADKLPKEIQYSLHPQHPRLVLRREDDFECNSCQTQGHGFAFSCKDCEFNIEPTCAFQTLSAIEDGAAACISHFAHEHPLMLAFSAGGSICVCDACAQSVNGIAYSCSTCSDFWFHQSCVELPLKLDHAFHPQHPLVLSEPPAYYFFCFACHEKHEGLAFYCAECEFYMGVECASLNPTLKHPRHEHPLAYCERNTTEQLQCSCCGKRCRYDFYRCKRCSFVLHGDCLHLPPTVNHKSHYWHLLQLCDKFVRGDPDDQFCDYCEMIRNPDHGVYRCEECDYSAHIECMISDDKEEAKGTETVGSDEHNQLNIEIASLDAQIEIMRRDLEAMEDNLRLSADELVNIENSWKT